jgi:hypothetical protein
VQRKAELLPLVNTGSDEQALYRLLASLLYTRIDSARFEGPARGSNNDEYR